MKLFPSETYHLLLNNENKCLGSTAIHRIQYKLNMLDEHIYPLLEDKGIPSMNVLIIKYIISVYTGKAIDYVFKTLIATRPLASISKW